MTDSQSLTNRAMLVKLCVHNWTARRFDREATAEVIDIHQATSDAGRFNKLLLPKIALRGVQSAVTAVRSHHATNTLPWTIDGIGLLPAANYFPYMAEHRRLALLLDVERDKFIGGFAASKAQAAKDLGDLYREDDYPSAEALRDAIGCELAVMPLPDSQDFRVRLGDAEEARIRDEITASVNAAIDGAVRSLWQRVHETVAAMHERLTAYKRDPETQKVTAPFRDSLVGNMRELVGLLGRLNVTSDPALESMRREMDERLCQAEPEDLRENDTLRAKQAADCAKILNLMQGYVGVPVAVAAE